MVVRGFVAAACLAWAAGCTPTCREACAHLFADCGFEYPDGYDEVECTASCETQRERLQDQEGDDVLADHLTCVSDASCAELEDGQCFDESLYLVPP